MCALLSWVNIEMITLIYHRYKLQIYHEYLVRHD